MKTFVPDYYERFACIKGDCCHSCCVGWEIDIDPESLERFRAVKGELGERLRQSICENAEGAFFRLKEDERCPFLNSEGLCDLILELGEGCLCQICDDHPKFRNFFSDRMEIGLGLCCEAAGQLILGREEPVRMCVIEDDGASEVMYEEEVELLGIRDALITIAQDRRMPVEERLGKMLEWLELEPVQMDADWMQFLLGLERLDENWAVRLKQCGELRTDCALSEWESSFEQLLVYLLYRHLPTALEDDDLAGRISYVVFVWMLVRNLCASAPALDFEELVEICRLYSSELEYSDENIAAIIERIHLLSPES